MIGWEKDGEPFRRMLNHGQKISDEASRVHGYTREILERDGEDPIQVYEAFANYVGDFPVVAYNLTYDWNRVLLPEWKRLGISRIGTPGFCALKLAQRLLDPVPAGNCKLQTLRQYYRLPESGAHTALGDVLTVVELMQRVLRPLTESRGLNSWVEIVSFAADAWFPSRIPFGKFKGRLFLEAINDKELREWLEWLKMSKNKESAEMGRWYLQHLQSGCGLDEAAFLDLGIQEDFNIGHASHELVVYLHPEAGLYQRLVEIARNRLVELELEFGIEKAKVDSIRSKLFAALRNIYQERDRLRILVRFRKNFIARLLSEGEDAADEATEDYKREKAQKDQEYDSTASALAGKRELSGDEAVRLKQHWKKLVSIFHPDLHGDDPEKRKTYEQLTQSINEARDRGDIEVLEQMARDPEAFILKQGWASVSLSPERGLREMRALYEHLQSEILVTIEKLDELRSSAEMKIFQQIQNDDQVIERIAAAQKVSLEQEIAALELEAQAREQEIEELTGRSPF
jgi:DNA polymerase-3 subunit epsilon